MEKQVQFFNNKTVFNENLDIPDSPGIYKFYDSQNEILYIGKAKNIKKALTEKKEELINLLNIKFEYLELRNILNLKNSNKVRNSKLFFAYFINKVRLIDNF